MERLRLARLGDTRALVYAIALGTGLRMGEIRRLRWCDIEGGVLHIPAASAKSRRDQAVPVPLLDGRRTASGAESSAKQRMASRLRSLVEFYVVPATHAVLAHSFPGSSRTAR